MARPVEDQFTFGEVPEPEVFGPFAIDGLIVVAGQGSSAVGREADPEAGEAQRRLLERYGAAVYRYLLASLRDSDAADELYQEFALRFVRGDFERATSGRGRFRDFLKAVLRNLVVDAHRRRVRGPLSLAGDTPETLVDDPVEEADRQFLETCRAELLARAWEALAAQEGSGGAPLHALLRYRADHPEATSSQIAEVFSASMGWTLSPEWVRKWLARARETIDHRPSTIPDPLRRADPPGTHRALSRAARVTSPGRSWRARRGAERDPRP